MRWIAAIVAFGVAVGAVAQTAQKPVFEVASIKANRSGSRQFRMTPESDRFVAMNVSLSHLLQFAFQPSSGPPPQIVGVPSWAETDRFDIQAKAGADGTVARDRMQLMVQSLLEDRFRVKAHREMRELPVYNLVVAKSGKLKLSQDQTPVDPAASQNPNPSGPVRGSLGNRGKPSPTALTMVLSGTAVRVNQFMGMLGQFADRPLIDKTGLSGLYDIELQFDMPYPATNAPARASEPGMSSLFTDLQDQLGLKLESAKAQFEVLVIDFVQRPSEN